MNKYLLLSTIIIIFVTFTCYSNEEVPMNISFKLLQPQNIKKTEPVSFGHTTLWGDFSYNYRGKIKFNNLIADCKFSAEPLVCFYYKDKYYFVNGRFEPLEFYCYYDKKLKRLSLNDIPVAILNSCFPDTVHDAKTLNINFQETILMRLLKTNQKKCQEVMQYFIAHNNFNNLNYYYGGFVGTFKDFVFENKIEPTLKTLFMEDVAMILKNSLTNYHNPHNLGLWISIILALDYSKGIIVVDDFLKQYYLKEKQGVLKIENLDYWGDKNISPSNYLTLVRDNFHAELQSFYRKKEKNKADELKAKKNRERHNKKRFFFRK